MKLRIPGLLLLLILVSACAPQAGRITSAAAPRTDSTTWAFERSDIAPEPEYRFGRLGNGMRYIIRRNANPKGTALVRLEVATGSLDETETERGFAHFVEHMAFNGSSNVPEGEMIRLLQRHGLAFGADTNATTGFESTTYMLDLPRANAELLGISLMLMRETASELKFDPEAVEREKGVVLSELRDRNTWQLRNGMDQARFLHPSALYPRRFPIGAAETLRAATAASLKAFWRREYVPAHTTLVVIGDFPPEQVEAEIRERFSTWWPTPAEPQPDAGPVIAKDKPRTGIYIDPALSERVVASQHGPRLDEPDSVATRRENVLRQIGYGIVNRRLQRVSRASDPPFRDAGLGTGDVFEAGRTTNLVVDTIDGKWRRGLVAAAIEVRRALKFGFAKGEVDEQVANLRTATENAAGSAATRSNGTLVNAVLGLLRNDLVPASPQSSLSRLNEFLPLITPDSVLAALRRELVPLGKPLLRFQGRRHPTGGEAALRMAWNEAMDRRIEPGADVASAGFAYPESETPGTVASDTREPQLGIRQVRFANGVRLNLKRTDIETDIVRLQVNIDGGDMLATRTNPLATQMVSMLAAGGLGKHSQDELQSVLAGRTIATGIDSGPDTFVSSAVTTPRDLGLQLRVLTAFVADPGFRPEGEIRYRLNINNFFNRMRATPGSALGVEIGGILSDRDPRFTLQKIEDYRKLTFAKLKADLADRLANGAIEIGVVGDIDEDAVIGQVARTFGALPPREPEFQAYPEGRKRPFTADRSLRVIRHDGPADQALLRLTWPTRDDSDPAETEALELLERMMRVELTDMLRERLGKAYSPGADSAPSRVYRDYGIFAVTASVDVADVPATRAALAQAIAELRDRPIDPDLVQRARQPMIEGIDNALKNNPSWLSLVDRAQTEPDRIDRYLKSKERLMAITPADIEALAKRYLDPKAAVEVLVLPKDVEAPKD